MKERPILFSGAMVRAILAGEKTQTRRPARNIGTVANGVPYTGLGGGTRPADAVPGAVIPCPYGEPGDRLWVRETWGSGDRFYNRDADPPSVVVYRADGAAVHFVPRVVELVPQPVPEADRVTWNLDAMTWRPSIHMPRWASRISLDVTCVRVERLHDIRDADIRAEGMTVESVAALTGLPASQMLFTKPFDLWRMAWIEINGRESWEANPWVWAIDFQRGEKGGAS